MKDNQLKAVAEKAGTSLSSVKKALGHCEGPGSDLRDRIYLAADEQGLIRNAGKFVDAYVILPSIPSFFWRNIMHVLGGELQERGIRAKCNFYSVLGDKDIVERYLREAEAMDARVILIAAKYEGLEERLAELAKRCAVFSLVETTQARNAFFIGSNPVEDGRLLAQKCLQEHPNAREILLIGNAPERMRGFCEAASGVRVRHLPDSKEEDAAIIARSLDRIWREKPFDVAVCLGGIAAKVCLALKKCRLEVPCYSFEHQHIDDRYAPPIGEICQDTSKIAQVAADATVDYLQYSIYPAQKHTYIPSAFYAQGIAE